MMKPSKLIVVLSLAVAALTIVIAAVGLFSNGGNGPFSFTTVRGEEVMLYGTGIYAYDLLFKGPIFRGTDAVMLVVTVPVLLFTIYRYSRKPSAKIQLFLTSVLFCILYYAISLVFGVVYNNMFVVYVALFSTSFYALIVSTVSLDFKQLTANITSNFPHRGVGIFLIIAAASLFVWFIDVIGSLVNNTIPAGVSIYTTEVTYALDLGLLAPASIIGGYLILKRKQFGYWIASCMITLCSLIGIIVIGQTVAQSMAGVTLELYQFIAFVGVFIVLSGIASLFLVRMYRNFA
ncbi:hypothetical protein EJF36_03130 [Bacillus sp. HMF5848]|uniref:hypothetical protein n=1 Tax=Bacillus sp. HMF5848 TaxID=2495421 RepID=UPI000F77AE78|nr:hypothetical protein [Bacillus sp. HMF5848]RSK25970.1 hypothetical protein EJF36_03130 [Bacillus sp. HMF5848]